MNYDGYEACLELYRYMANKGRLSADLDVTVRRAFWVESRREVPREQGDSEARHVEEG